MFARSWAEALLQRVRDVRQVRAEDAEIVRAYDQLDEWAPSADQLAYVFRKVWAAEHTMVWTAFQLERWTRRLAQERGLPEPTEDPVLKLARDALEHLDDASFVDGEAVADPFDKRKGRSLRALGRLPIQVSAHLVIGQVDPDDLERRAMALVRSIENDMEQQIRDYLDATGWDLRSTPLE